MNTEQIIKALECCDGTLDGCEDCPYNKDGIGCKYRLPTDALALIKSQQGQIVGLNSALDALRDVAKDYENHNENLKRENKYLRESLADEREHKEDMSVSELKAEIEILSKENETLKITTIDQYSHLCDCHDKIAEMLRQKESDTVKRMQESFSNLLEKEYKQYTPDGADHYFKNGSHMMWSIADRVFNQIAKEMLEGGDTK